MKALVSLAVGTLFGLGLAVSGMTDRFKVLGFLDVAGGWDPTLLVVMASALAVALPGFHVILRRARPLLGSDFNLPASTHVDVKLLFGSALFGVGWGLYGYCPGPAIAALTYVRLDALVFVLAMLVGTVVTDTRHKLPT